MDKEIMYLMRSINRDFDVYLKTQLKLQGVPIKAQHSDLFVILYKIDGRIEFKDLVKAWGRSKSTLSETVNRYVEKGVLKKEATSVDKRLVYISLTELGKSYSDNFKSIYRDYSSNLIGGIDGQDEKAIKNLLNQIVENIEK